MFGFRPPPAGWCMIGGTILLLGIGALWWGFAVAGIFAASVVGVSLARHVKAAPAVELPDPIARMVTFKANRRKAEAKAWDEEYCDALGFDRSEHWHRHGAVEKARKGETYWAPKALTDPPVKMRTTKVGRLL